MLDWDERYSEPGYAYGTEPNDFLRQHLASLPTGRVLSLAEGEGRNAVFLAEQGFTVSAVDASAVALRKAAELAAQRGVQFDIQVHDLASFAIPPASWPAVVSIFCHIPLAARQRLHAQVVNGLVPGGILLLEAYTPAQLALGTGGPRDAALTMTAAALREELRGLEFLLLKETRRPVLEGKYHTGSGAVVQCLARKPVA